MTTLDLYIIRHLLVSCLVVVLVLLSIFGFFELMDQLDDVGKHQYSYADAFTYTAYTLPRHLIRLIPFIALIGTVVSFSLLAARNELVAMLAAGVSSRRIVGMSLVAGAVLIALNLGFEQFVAPYLDKRAFDMRASALQQYEGLGGGRGLWARSPEQILRVGTLQHGREPVDVELFVLDAEGKLKNYIFAERARIESPDRWVFEDVVHKQLGGETVNFSRHEQYAWQPFLGLAELSSLLRPAESLSPTELYAYIRHLRVTDQPAEQFSLTLWEKFGRILMTLAMILIAVHMILRTPHRAMGVPAILVMLGALVFALLDRIIGNTALLWNFPPVVAALAPEFVLLGIGLLLYRKPHDMSGVPG